MLSLSLVAAHPIPIYPHTIAIAASAPTDECTTTAMWNHIATFRQNLSDPRYFTIVLFAIAAINLLTVVLALILYRVTRPRREPEPMPRREVRHLRAVSVDLKSM